jgi:hypothetical protein
MGNFSSPQICGDAVMLGKDLYTLQYGDQLNRSGKLIELMPKNQLVYEQIEGDLEEHIVKEFVNPMRIANRLGDNKRFKHLKNQLINFSEESVFSEYALDLCDALENDPSNDNLIQSYISNIVSSVERE